MSDDSYWQLFFFFFYGYGSHRDLHLLTHSFPTRRSSDLGGHVGDLAFVAGAAHRYAVVAIGDRTCAQGHAVQAVRARTGTQRRRAVRRGERALAQRRAALAARPAVPADRRRVPARRPRAVAERRRAGATGFGRDQPEERAAAHRSRF